MGKRENSNSHGDGRKIMNYKLHKASEAVVARWDMPTWQGALHMMTAIDVLRVALFEAPLPVMAPEWVMLTGPEMMSLMYDTSTLPECAPDDVAMLKLFEAVQEAFIAKQGGAK
jgi:hypothetical protein